MKKLYKLGILLSAVGILASCYQEDDLTPSENGMILRYEMPQGNNAWDEDIAQIYEEYGVYLVYKGLKDAVVEQCSARLFMAVHFRMTKWQKVM